MPNKGPVLPVLSTFMLIGSTDHSILFHRESAAYVSQPVMPEFWTVWRQENRGCTPFAGSEMHQPEGSYPSSPQLPKTGESVILERLF